MPSSSIAARVPRHLSRRLSLAVHVTVVASLLLAQLVVAPAARAQTLPSAAFSGGTGTAPVDGDLYATSGAALTLTVATTEDTRCVVVSGAHSATQSTGNNSLSQSLWTFEFTAAAGDSARQVTVTTSAHHNCGQGSNARGTATAAYVTDNTGPVVTAALSPAANAAGWHNTDVAITWSATDAGSGVASGPTPATDTVDADTAGVTRTATAADHLGNTGNGSVSVKLDRTAPVIAGSRSPAANEHGWNSGDVTVTFACSDALSGIDSCAPSATVSAEGAGQEVVGEAADNAGNSASATVAGISIDRTAPSLSGTPTAAANSAGWYREDVTITWTADDALSGIDPATAPADSVIAGEGEGLVASAIVRDRAGNATGATSPAVSIDRTPPQTTVTAPPAWNNTDVAVTLVAADALSGVEATHYRVNGGAPQTGTSVGFSAEGVHELEFWSTDRAGNVEAPRTVGVKIDKTPPTISHTLDPAANAFGWNRTDVTVTFLCDDALSGIAACTGPQTVETEGADQPVTGTALDNAGNTATDPATVSIDRTPPTISASPDRAAGVHGWYDADVSVTFTCDDALSGILSCPAPVTLGEGAGQTAGGTATDTAGNDAAASVTGLDIDTTPPTLTGTPSTSGWATGDVTVTWACFDALSGIDGDCPDPGTVTGEGAEGSASASVSDRAGHTTSTTVYGIRIDRTPPTTTADVPEPLASGWYAGAVEVTLTGHDALSGIAATYYRLPGGEAQAYDGPFTHDVPGVSTITFYSVDVAGNVEDAEHNTLTLRIDDIPPTVTASRFPDANADGWNNEPVTVAFECSDAESGIPAGGCPDPVTLAGAGAGQSVERSVSDVAGNASSARVDDINIDLEAPVTTASAPGASGDGWHAAAVTVTLDATDDLAGVAATSFSLNGGPEQAYDGPFTVVGDGEHTLSYWSVDRAGNAEGPRSLPLRIDTTDPGIEGKRLPAANAHGWNNQPVDVTFTCTDGGSGIASCTAGETLAGEGADQSVTGTAVDRAGNSASTTVGDVHIDLTPPTIEGERTPAANVHGWNATDVTVSFTCADALSDIAFCSGPSVLDGEGAEQSRTGYAKDRAGNVASATVTGVSIDKTPPTLSGAPTSEPNAAGWYAGDVTISWTAGDELSGLDPDTVPAPSTIGGEGADLSATASVSDRAGNSTQATVGGIAIDRTPPLTTTEAPAAWRNGTVTLDLDASDNLSGVAATYFALNGGEPEIGNQVVLAGEGVHTVALWSVDEAGNTEAPKTVEVRIDLTAPTIRHELDPEPNAAGWNSADVTVTFLCDDEGGSGLASCTGPQSVATEGEAQPVDGFASDHAGNTATDRAFVSLDKTPPTISGAPDRDANAHGWYNADVTVAFDCGDALSGIASCSAPETLGHGAGLSVTGTAIDTAGNAASATVAGIDIDTLAPTLSGAATSSPNAAGWYAGDVTVAWTCADADSGIDGDCPANSVVGGEGSALAANAEVTDRAGNSTPASVTGLRIDRTAPTTQHYVPAPVTDDGWYAGAITVELVAIDNLSGVDATYYTIAGGDEQAYGGPFSVSGSGAVEVAYHSVDEAGNVEDTGRFTVLIDDTDPEISGSRTPGANSFGWNNTTVTVTFECADEHSGIAGCEPDHVLENEGAGQGVTGQALDRVGRTATASVPGINIDLTKPSLSGAPTDPANAAGWYRGDVTIRWTAEDGLSGIDPATVPADSVITGEGDDLGAGPVSVSDRAGNTRTASVGGIRIDRTDPDISGSTIDDDGTPRAPNAAGWFDSPVRVRFACADELSGVANCADDRVLAGDGAGQSASGVAEDVAGNTSVTHVTGINIDSQAPETSAETLCTLQGGWCTGETATVVLSATDQAGLSGVAEIRYRVGGGAEQVAAGDEVDVTVPLDGTGEATVHFRAVDHAGNVEQLKGVALQHDNIAPIVTGHRDPLANAAGWNAGDVTVSFTATDDEGGSGIDEATITAPVTLTDETAGQVVAGEAYDLAGNRGETSVEVKLDRTDPTISGAPASSPNANGWYSSDVTVAFECDDDLSGVASCTGAVTLTSDGAHQQVTGTATDAAGNTASMTVTGINIDSVKPEVTILGVEDGAIYVLGAVPQPSCAATDAGSGLLGPCSGTLSGGTPNAVGTFTYSASATDRAGNVGTKVVTYRVVYRWDGFLQPITDTAHQQGTASIFKAQSNVPAKFELKQADGTLVLAGSAPKWLEPARGSQTSAPADETHYGDVADSGDTYRLDGSKQYHYNWKTDRNQAGFYWRIGVRLDDGQTHYVNIGLR